MAALFKGVNSTAAAVEAEITAEDVVQQEALAVADLTAVAEEDTVMETAPQETLTMVISTEVVAAAAMGGGNYGQGNGAAGGSSSSGFNGGGGGRYGHGNGGRRRL
ncbi:hypothetical protein MTO96_009692 [Rhipicephalus appendiculatus]